jgi:DNA invertase Pin-like site-specific DNA recombinase
MTATQLTGREFQRVSLDRSGRQKSNAQQHTENLAQGPDWGITQWGPAYSEVGSASRHRRKARADFPQLLEDLTSGSFGAQVLVLWEASRGSRELEEWLPLLRACEGARVMIGVTNIERLFRPWVARDRHDLIDLANDAELESAQISQRTGRDAASAAEAGRPHGKCPYGYQRSFDPESGQVKWSPHPEESAVVVELFERLARGESLAGIARSFQEQGHCSRGSRNVPARPFLPQTLRGMALAPVYAGLRVHEPGHAARAHRGTRGATHRGSWDALVPDELFYAVKARLTDPSRSTVRPGRGVHLLSMLATCGAVNERGEVCGSPLVVTYRKGPKAYQCHQRGCVKVKAQPLEDWATRQVLGLLSAPDVFDALLDAGTSEDLQEARDAVARLSAERVELLARLAAEDDDDPEVLEAKARRVRRQLLEAEQRAAALSTPVALRGLITPGPHAAAQWEDATMATKREVIRGLFSDRLLGPLSVARQTPGTRPGREPIEARVRLNGEPLPLEG